MRAFLLSLGLLVACSSRDRAALDASVDADDGPHGSVCGGFAHTACGATEYCDYADNGCGIGNQSGTCKARPTECPLDTAFVAMPTCACDGKVYGSDCDAFRNGVDVNAHGTCSLDAGRFACGYQQCLLATQYCKRERLPAAADLFTCVGIPTCTGAPSCACLAAQPCGSSCSGDSRVGLTLTCAP